VLVGLCLALLAAAPAPAGADRAGPFACDPLAELFRPPGAALARLPAGAAVAGLEEPNVEQAYARQLATPSAQRTPRRIALEGPVRVPVHLHVVQPDATEQVSDAQIAAQIDVLNESFAGGTGGADSGFVFDLVRSERTINPAWAPLEEPDGNNPSAAETAMKSALRRGGARALNVYIVELPLLLGWATFPASYELEPGLDGVVVTPESVPGTAIPNWPYGEGDTLVHEVGHWLGLFHTFQGGCTEPNDLVADTPQADDEDPGVLFGCPEDADSCPAPGLDPIDNFMAYTDDDCMDKFTPGQVERMQQQGALFRNGPPRVPNRSVATESGEPVAVSVAASDPDGDALRFSVLDPPDRGTLQGAGPDLIYVPERGFSGTDRLTVAAHDVFGATGAGVVRVEVRDRQVRLRLRAKKRQRLDRLAVRAGCGSESCGLRASGRIVVRRGARSRSFPIRPASKRARAGRQAKLRLRVAGRRGRRLRALLDSRPAARARVRVRAKDGAGNRASRSARIVVRR
jgi:hypothetical protein